MQLYYDSYVGVDWASRGWLVVATDGDDWTARMHPSIHSVWYTHADAKTILVDIPIGLPESERRGCDRGAKEFLGSGRARSVFWTPCRKAVEADTYEDAKRANIDARGDSLSSQAWGMSPRIQEVDRFLRDTTEAQNTIVESHPEVCFRAFAERNLSSKHVSDGLHARRELLEEIDESVEGVYESLVDDHIESPPQWARRIGNSNRDDLLDAMALALTAKVGENNFKRILDSAEANVESIPKDRENVPMQIVYADPE